MRNFTTLCLLAFGLTAIAQTHVLDNPEKITPKTGSIQCEAD